jgi:pimeloyl-ACP methyl ester carboxylesterase
VRGAIVSNCPAGIRTFLEEVWRLVDEMPPWPRRALRRRDLRSPAYQAALMWFRLRHVVQLRYLPDIATILHSLWLMLRSPSFWRMWGPDDLHVTGNLRDWERADRLGEIDVPVMVVTGERDEVTPRLALDLAAALPRASAHILAGCSHLAFFERPRLYMDLLRPFLRLHDLVGEDPAGRARIV